MDTEKFLFDLEVVVKPIYLDKTPRINYSFNNQVVENFNITELTTIKITDQIPLGKYKFCFEFFNKEITDTTEHHDLAVSIESVKINGIEDIRFLYKGLYYPNYPDYYVQENLDKNIKLESCLSYATYIGWNGTWILEIESPIFTWMHQVLDFGTIYQV